MKEATQTMQSIPTKPSAGGRFLGFPLNGFGLFSSLVMTVATGFFAFFISTFLAIIALLIWNQIGGHTVDYADSYRYVGFPAGVAAMAVAFVVFGTLWVRAKLKS
jgi:membrane-associated phospholipid phosphatase